jgi:hypothetical protein
VIHGVDPARLQMRVFAGQPCNARVDYVERPLSTRNASVLVCGEAVPTLWAGAGVSRAPEVAGRVRCLTRLAVIHTESPVQRNNGDSSPTGVGIPGKPRLAAVARSTNLWRDSDSSPTGFSCPINRGAFDGESTCLPDRRNRRHAEYGTNAERIIRAASLDLPVSPAARHARALICAAAATPGFFVCPYGLGSDRVVKAEEAPTLTKRWRLYLLHLHGSASRPEDCESSVGRSGLSRFPDRLPAAGSDTSGLLHACWRTDVYGGRR